VLLNINRATKTLASTFGVLIGLAGIQHGIFEILQGNIATNDFMIDAIGPEQRLWEYATETALTIIPNFLITGILAVIFGLLVTICAWLFIEKKYGAWIFELLSLILWLVGGGFAPILMALFGFLAAIKIKSSLSWWRNHLPITLRNFLSKLWPWSLIVYVLVFVFGVEIAVFGYPLLWIFNANATYTIQWSLAIIMVILWPISIITAFAHDITKKEE
jgi:hypothetical protein